MFSLKVGQRGNGPALHGSRAGSLAIAISVVLLAGLTITADAHGGHHGSPHNNTAEGESHFAGGRRHGNDSYMKAAAAERDKLLTTKLKSICRGC